MPSDERAAARIDDAAECIWRGGEKIGVPPKAFLVLRRLMERPGQLVTKADLMDTVWPATAVTETVLNNAIAQLRQALGDDRRTPQFIETVHRRGFRWIGTPKAASKAPAPTSTEPSSTGSGLAASVTDDLVGRSTSLASLARSFALAAAGRRQLVLMTGEPGIGKTTLLDAFLSALQSQSDAAVVVARGQCIEAYGVGDLYRPVREAVEQLLRRGDEKMVEAIRQHAPGWLASVPGFATAAELEALQRSEVASSSERMQAELERALEAVCADCTVVIALEDLHWSDPATIAALWGLAVGRERARLLVIGTYRSVDAIAKQHPVVRLKHELVTRRQCVELAIEGLTAEAVAAFLDSRFPGHELPEWLAPSLTELSAGNPLFLLNALDDLVSRGWLVADDRTWRCTASAEAVATAVPESTRDLIAFRLDQLPPAPRLLLEAASIVGTSFSAQDVGAAEQRSSAEIESELEPLARAAHFVERAGEVAWPDGSLGCEYRFRHALYRQVLGRRVTPARRQLAHRRIAAALEKAYGERCDQIAASLSLHHEQAGNVLRAIDYIEILARQAYARAAVHEVQAMYRHAVDLLRGGAMDADRQERMLRLLIALGMATGTLQGAGSSESLAIFEEARRLGQSMGSAPGYVASLSAIIASKTFMRQIREALQLAQEMLVLAPSDDSSSTALVGHMQTGQNLMFLGELEAAVAHLEKAVASVDGTAADADTLWASGYDPASPAIFNLGLALTLSGHFDEGRRSVERSLAIARAKSEPFYRTYALNSGSLLAAMLHDTAEARRLSEEGLEGDMSAMPFAAETSPAIVAWADVREKRDPAMLDPLRQAAELACGAGVLPAIRLCSLLADACLAIGRIEDAQAAVEAAFRSRGDARFYDAELLRQQAEVLLARAEESADMGPREQAVQVLEQAMRMAHSQGARLFELRAAIDLCRLLDGDDRADEARERLASVLAGVRGGSTLEEIRQASAVLGQSTRPPQGR
ncbi:MAG TPA: AAA family ATPase [Candidatus Binatia bacterium]|nr:AAA family ATPase [Candidatus Binatia bacterium]